MKAQEPAEGLLKVSEYGNSIAYQVACDCSEPDHAQVIDIEADDDGFVVVTIYTDTSNDHRQNRFSLMWEALIRGYIKTNASIILTEQVALNYTTALTKAMTDLKKLKNASDN